MAIPRNLANIAPHANASSTEFVINDGSADLDFRVESDGNANMLFVDAGNNRVGIGVASPGSILSIASSTGIATTYKHPSNNADFYISNYNDADGNAAYLGSNFYVDSSGNLQRGDTGKPSAAINIAGRTGDGFIRFYTGSGAATEQMRIDPSGNVRLGWADTSLYWYFDDTYNMGIRALNTSARTLNIFTKAADNNDEITFSTGSGPTERARITSGGYFKVANNGTYYGGSGLSHQFTQSDNDYGLICFTSNASYTSGSQITIATRSANSAYSLYSGFSDSGNDLEFRLRGDGNGYADGTWNNNGADYAEFFESANGQALTLGATVVLDGTKVREATAQDDPKSIIGVVRPKEPSKASMVVGNTAWNKWANKYLTDDFDRYIMEDHDVVEWEEIITDEEGGTSTKQHSYESHNIPAGVTVPADAVRKTHDDKGNKFQHYKLNPAWDKDAEYTPREKRPEWNIIGLLGQVKILKGQPVSDRWIKMRDVSATVEEWMIR